MSRDALMILSLRSWCSSSSVRKDSKMGRKGELSSVDLGTTSMPLWSRLVPGMILVYVNTTTTIMHLPHSWILGNGFSALLPVAVDWTRLSCRMRVSEPLINSGLRRRVQDGHAIIVRLLQIHLSILRATVTTANQLI